MGVPGVGAPNSNGILQPTPLRQDIAARITEIAETTKATEQGIRVFNLKMVVAKSGPIWGRIAIND